MNCASVENVLDLYREDRLTPRRTRAVEAHLAACPACRALATPAIATTSVKAPDDLKARLLSALRAAPAAAPRASAGPVLWPNEARGIAVATAALILVGALIAATGAPAQSPSVAAAIVEEP